MVRRLQNQPLSPSSCRSGSARPRRPRRRSGRRRSSARRRSRDQSSSTSSRSFRTRYSMLRIRHVFLIWETNSSVGLSSGCLTCFGVVLCLVLGPFFESFAHLLIGRVTSLRTTCLSVGCLVGRSVGCSVGRWVGLLVIIT